MKSLPAIAAIGALLLGANSASIDLRCFSAAPKQKAGTARSAVKFFTVKKCFMRLWHVKPWPA